MLVSALSLGVTIAVAAPAGYGSADGKVRAKVPVARPIKRSGPKKDTIERKEAADGRRALVVSDLEIAEGASLPAGVDYAELVRSLIEPSKKLRLVFAPNCFALECMRKAAAEEGASDRAERRGVRKVDDSDPASVGGHDFEGMQVRAPRRPAGLLPRRKQGGTEKGTRHGAVDPAGAVWRRGPGPRLGTEEKPCEPQKKRTMRARWRVSIAGADFATAHWP